MAFLQIWIWETHRFTTSFEQEADFIVIEIPVNRKTTMKAFMDQIKKNEYRNYSG